MHVCMAFDNEVNKANKMMQKIIASNAEFLRVEWVYYECGFRFRNF